MPSNHLRLGIFRDRPVFEASAGLYDAVVVPAHIAAHSADGLWGFLTGVGAAKDGGLRFFYDPMSYWLELPPQFWLRGSEHGAGDDVDLPVDPETIRPAFRRLLEAYGLIDAVRTLDTAQFQALAIDRLPAAVLDFQRTGARNKTQKAVGKYAAILGLQLDASALMPSRLVAPYLSMHLQEGRYEAQAALNAATLELAQPGEELWSVLAFSNQRGLGAMSAAVRGALAVNRFAGIGLWVGGLDEYTADAATLRAYRALVRSLARPVWLMFGGYFGALMQWDGVAEVSHGIFYTESKRVAGPVGSGPPADRYYVPALHRFYEPARAFRIAELLPELQCLCPECPDLDTLRQLARSAIAGTPQRMEWAQRLQRHFLWVREREFRSLASSSSDAVKGELGAVVERVSKVPTAQRLAARLTTDHLETWIDALGDGDTA